MPTELLFGVYQPFKIIISIIITVSLGFLAGLLTMRGISTWYPTLTKPWFTPPNLTFPVAWTTLYILMGAAAGIVWSYDTQQPQLSADALWYYRFQLALNILWSLIFFGLQAPFAALVEIVVLWVMLYRTGDMFNNIDRIAGLLFIPYLLWVTFATLLNAVIWWEN